MKIWIPLVCALLSVPSAASERPTYGVMHLIQDQDVATKFISMVEMFGYLQEYEIVYGGRSQLGLAAIMVDGLISGGQINPEKIQELPDDLRAFVLELKVSEKPCFIHAAQATPKTDEAGLPINTDKANTLFLAMADTRHQDLDQQMDCLSGAMVVSFGYRDDVLTEALGLPVRDRILAITNGDLKPQPKRKIDHKQ